MFYPQPTAQRQKAPFQFFLGREKYFPREGSDFAQLFQYQVRLCKMYGYQTLRIHAPKKKIIQNIVGMRKK